MSLVEHVSAVDGLDFNPEPREAVRRNITYDVFPQAQDAVNNIPRTPAYKVSTAKRIGQVIVTIIACWLSSGIVFGFAALKPVLISERVYRDLCMEWELQDNVEIMSNNPGARLNLLYIVGSITANVSALPVGTILDRYGSRICGFAACVFLTAGSLLMASSFSQPYFDGYIIGNIMLALGGTFIFVPSFQVANAFPRHAGTIVALVTGAFDASAAVYLFYKLLYDASQQALTLDKFFLGYLIVPALLFLALSTRMAGYDYQSMQQLEAKIERAEDATRDVHESDEEFESGSELQRVRSSRAENRHDKIRILDEVLGDKDQRNQRELQEEERQGTSRVWGVLHGQPAHKQMATPWFILIALLTVLQMLRMNYFIATIRSQYEYMLNSDTKAAQINGFFDVILPVGGVIFTPLIGFSLDHLSVPAILAIIVLLTTIVGVMNSVPAVWAGYITVSCFVLLRPLYYSAMSDYATKVFGLATFGRVYGTIIFMSGLFNFSLYGLDALTHGPFNNNPIPINAFLTSVSFVVGTVLVVFVEMAGRRMEQGKRADERRYGERQRLIAEENEENED